MAMKDILSKDFLGYTCIEEKDLDLAFTISAKEGQVPQTCFEQEVPRDINVVSEFLGREPTPEEWSIFKYRWCEYHEAEGCSLDAPDFPEVPSAVPLPDSLGFMIGILCIFTIVKLFKNMDDMENIR